MPPAKVEWATVVSIKVSMPIRRSSFSLRFSGGDPGWTEGEGIGVEGYLHSNHFRR